MNRARLVLTGVVMALVAACAPPPTEPTPLPGGPQNPKDLVTSIRVEGVEPQVGQTSQLTALATLADGQTKDVTSEATWRLRGNAVAQVSPEGRLSGIRVGVEEVTATLREVSGSKRLMITGSGTYFMVLSEPGDPIGRGEMESHNFIVLANLLEPNAINVQYLFDGAANVREPGLLNQPVISALPSGWDAIFAAPEGQIVTPGTYEIPPLVSPVPPMVATMRVRIGGAQCAQRTGRFVVRAAEYGGGRSVTRLDLGFEQRCEGATGSLRGEIGYRK